MYLWDNDEEIFEIVFSPELIVLFQAEIHKQMTE